MPKVIDNLRETIINETKKIMLEKGYSAVSVRSVSKSCNIASGTIYNYFHSKEAMIAACMMDDWKQSLMLLKEKLKKSPDIESMLRDVFNTIREFCEEHAYVIGDPDAIESFGHSSRRYHITLVTQVSDLIDEKCKSSAKEYSPELSSFVAENLILHASDGRDFEGLYGVIRQLFISAPQK